MTKYIICLGDGMADHPIKQLNNKTPLSYAKTPAMDWVARKGRLGMVHSVPNGLHPGSDVANMGILGYNPKQYYTGRGPIEAASMGVPLPEGKLIFRCNLVTIQDEKMLEFTAGHITTEESHQLIDELNNAFNGEGVQFFPGVSYRHIVVLDEKYKDLVCCAPHDILDQSIADYTPKGVEERGMENIMAKAQKVLTQSKINQKRREADLAEANSIWPWSQGKYPSLPSFKEKYNLTGGIITAVDLLKGLAKLAGLSAPDVKGATGFLDTNYKGKVESALDILKKEDFVYLHVEAPDEAGHMGDERLKVKAIEDFDQNIVAPVLSYVKNNSDVRMMVLPDHPTPCAIRTHTSDPVPFCMYGHEVGEDNHQKGYSEAYADESTYVFETPWQLTDTFLEVCS